jgi:hypothetical protein
VRSPKPCQTGHPAQLVRSAALNLVAQTRGITDVVVASLRRATESRAGTSIRSVGNSAVLASPPRARCPRIR